eukprot:TRINITY_DN45_c0_g1_i4.p1 TRINITY_DN45_c0_g1~~TRINITY_DN45_c0_g1_i4.p1  ORF type:complete len:779 (+),score=212.20 TRINITY_DN45_c0_g1_i4:210-2546(+)
MKKLEDLFKPDESYKEIIAKGKQWTDSTFPHDGSVVKGINDVSGWMRASELFKGKEKIYESFSADDIEQGVLGDCYLLAAVAALAEFPGRVQQLFLQQERNNAGCYVVRLFICGQYVNIHVDDYFPIDPYKRPAFAGSKGQELWVMLIEKAWAKLHGAFAVIEGGDSRESFAAITGAPVEYYKHKDLSNEELWKLISTADEANCVMCTGASDDVKGIVGAHAYTLVNVFEFTNKGENVRLVQIRNPWACTEWTGAWSDNDPRWTAELRKRFNHRAADDGMFYMPFSDFAKVYIHTFVCRSRDDYLHSSLAVPKRNAFAMFKVRKNIKGFISAYEITKRLGETIVAGYVIAQMKLELHKFDKEKKVLVPIKAVYNNGIGQANMAVELEKGLYVVVARYEKDTKIPFITFSSYTDVKVTFVELKVEDASEITYERLKETFRTVKVAYKTKGSSERRFAGAFRRCLEKHRLEWIEATYTDSDTYLCESCRQKTPFTNGCWVCKKCKYEICPKCRPRHVGRVKKEEKKETVICNREHPMKFRALEDPDEIYLCSKCGRAYFGIVKRWDCEECRMDLCRNCIAPPEEFKGEVVPEIETCYNGHGLEFSRAEMRSGMYKCDLCAKMGHAHDGRWTCFECGVSICHVCKPAKDATEALVSAQTKTMVCDNGHVLAFSCSPPKPGFCFCCDKCDHDVPKDNWRWTCDACEFDVCTNCRPAQEGRKDLICPNMHMLGFTKEPLERATFTRCDCCYKAFKLASGVYCCLSCEYTYCTKCVDLIAQSLT